MIDWSTQLTSRYLSSPNPHFPCSIIRPSCLRMFGSRILEVSNLRARRQLRHSNFDAKFCCSFIRRRLKSVAFVENFHSDVATLEEIHLTARSANSFDSIYRLHISAASWSNSRRNWMASPRLSLVVFDTTRWEKTGKEKNELKTNKGIIIITDELNCTRFSLFLRDTFLNTDNGNGELNRFQWFYWSDITPLILLREH